MTSIRTFSEILMARSGGSKRDQQKYSTMIHDETIRQTRLLDDLLDPAVLENGQVTLNYVAANLGEVLNRAVTATTPHAAPGDITILRDVAAEDIAIATEIMHQLGGDVAYLPGQGGAAFRVTMPRRRVSARAAE